MTNVSREHDFWAGCPDPTAMKLKSRITGTLDKQVLLKVFNKKKGSFAKE